ncbi:ankyrin repeat domain-containing protein [Joostella atrarenae]|uniref:Ankyrin repeat domain-containing protein n=1 Tax=Joostella atrarenae TaxID=679257 RepID=A0ABS9J6P7_9FLAO|nr:ankyrin repeat domain-containing protein [Joostella atrarenae]MCF8716055.1 ankyrin repeat domain-containing protein [Joostella atrarenae]
MKIRLNIIILLIFGFVSTAQKVTYQDLDQLIEESKLVELKAAVFSNKIDVNTVHIENGELPLLYAACSAGDIDVIKYLLQEGADPNAISGYGMPANWAAEKGNLEAINLLLDYGFEPQRETLAYWMDRSSKKDSLPMLMRELTDYVIENELPVKDLPYTVYTGPSDPLILTAAIVCDSIGDFALAKRLISVGTNVNLSDKRGKTALHIAIESFNVSAVSFLIKNGANVNKPIKSEKMFQLFNRKEYDDNLTPLHYVLFLSEYISEFYDTHRKEAYKTVKLLLKAGADPYVVTKADKYNVFQKANQLGDAKLIRIISRSK